MRGILLLATMAVSASGGNVKTKTGQATVPGNSGQAGAVGAPGSAPGGAVTTLPATSLQATMPGVAPAPAVDMSVGAEVPAAARRDAAPLAAPAGVPAPVSASAPGALGAQLDGAARAAAPREAAAPAAGETLGGAARGVREGMSAEAAGAGDGLSLRAALDKAFDAAAAGAALGAGGVTRNAVAGSVQDARGRIDQTLAIARAAPPADAPGHYRSAVKIAEESLPASAARAVAAAVRTFARSKAERALPELAAAAYAAASGGAAGETARLLKGFDAWESLLGAPGRPLVANGAMLQADVRRRLDAAAKGGAPVSTPKVWFQKRGEGYVAALPGSAVAKLAPLAASFALSPAALPGGELAAAWRAYASDPRASRGFAEVYKGRLARGGSVPGAALAASRFWLRAALASLWRRLLELFAPAAYDLASPAGERALREDAALQAEVSSAGAAVRVALDSGAPTVGSARAALAALRRQAAAHERLRGAGALAAAEALSAAFESSVAGRPGSEPLGVAGELLLGPDGALRQARLLSRDAAESVDRRLFAGAGASGLRRAEGARLWVARSGVRLSADLRAPAAGGFVSLRAPGDAALAARLSELGFAARLAGGVVAAELDAESADVSAEAMAALAERALSAADGASGPSSATELRALVAAVSSDRGAAARRARSLDGRASGGRLLGRVSVGGVEYDAVTAGGVSFLRSFDGLPAFAAP